MTLKSIFWTTIVAVIVFFVAVYLGMKYNWVQDAKPKLATSANVEQTNTIGSVSLEKTEPLKREVNAKSPELIDEPASKNSTSLTLGSSELSIESVVSQCQSLTQSVGIPEAQVEQAMLECIERNSGHLTVENSALDDQSQVIRERCNSAITQRELLSEEEIKMLLDECVASSI